MSTKPDAPHKGLSHAGPSPYEQVLAEADLSDVPLPLHETAIGMILVSGLTDLASDLVGEPGVVAAVQGALIAGRPVFCDCEMVRAGIDAGALPEGCETVVTLNDPAVPGLAREMGTTRSAAAIALWGERLAGAPVVIGNAPTALFHLLETIAAGGPKPAAIIGMPVGFVGAAESKDALIGFGHDIPFLTVRGRRGGSALASAAFNAMVPRPAERRP